MEVRMLEKNKDRTKMVLMIRNTSNAYVNSLRRYFMNEVPVMAITEVEFKKNSSAMYDEMIAHRVGLIPLKTDLKGYNLPSECKCGGEGCALCQTKLTLKAKGVGTVYSSELKAKDPKIKPVYTQIPIVKLIKGQELEFVATASLGMGKDHAKFSPGHVWFKNKPSLRIDKKCNKCGECIKNCPEEIFKHKNADVVINQDNVIKCLICDACREVCPQNCIIIETDPRTFIFNIESWGQLDGKQIVKRGVEDFSKKLERFVKLVNKIGTKNAGVPERPNDG